MIIKVLVENTSTNNELGCEHGLSLYIETEKHKILFDSGASDLFAKNAEKMMVDLGAVDIAIISHGHYDHGGGLSTFLTLNNKARVYMQQKSFGKYYVISDNGERYIGLDQELKGNKRFSFVDNYIVIDDELTLFADVRGQKYMPTGNRVLYKGEGDSYLPDDFLHEQNLIIKEKDNTLLIAGCSHSGIVNILEQYQEDKLKWPDSVIGGFHLYNPSDRENEDPIVIAKIGEYLKETGSKYYTCHCTGSEPYQQLKNLLGDNIDYLSTGSQLII